LNKQGHAGTLQAAQPGNRNAERHGVYSGSGRPLDERAQEIADMLMAAPHVDELDTVAAQEIGKLISLIERVDHDLAGRGLTTRTGVARNLMDLRIRLSSRLERWLAQFGGTPKSRADWAAVLAGGNLASEIARRRTERGRPT
jgi:hypothetical protein